MRVAVKCPSSPHNGHIVDSGHLVCRYLPTYVKAPVPLSETLSTGARWTVGGRPVNAKAVRHFVEVTSGNARAKSNAHAARSIHRSGQRSTRGK